MLLRFYPCRFRAEYGDEAMLLFRERVRHERGFMAKLQLWIDIFADLLISIPHQYGRFEAPLACSPAERVDGAPEFRVLSSGVPGPGALLSGCLLSLVAFGVLFLWVAHGRNYRELHTWQGPTKHSLHLRTIARSPLQEATEGGMRLAAQWKPAHLVLAKSATPGMAMRIGNGQSALQSVQPPAEQQSSAPLVQDATAAMIQAIQKHGIVMFGESHGGKQEYEWLCKLVNDPQFAALVDDIVVEFGNSLYQKSVDRYIAGEDIPIEQVEKAWRNMVGSFGPPSPVYGWFYKAVRDSNLKHHGTHKIRLVLGDPYGDWDKIKDAEDLGPYVANREQWYVQVVKDEVLAKKHRALLIMGEGHFLRRPGQGYVEHELRAGGADPYLIVLGTNAVGGYDQLDPRFDSWAVPAIVPLAGNWVGALPAMPVVTGGMAPPSPLKLADAADAILYLASRDALTEVHMPLSELVGTAYGDELVRRARMQSGRTIEFTQPPEDAQFPRPHPQAGGAAPHTLPPPPKSIHDPLPPRPPSQ
jgi:hypothetical protein